MARMIQRRWRASMMDDYVPLPRLFKLQMHLSLYFTTVPPHSRSPLRVAYGVYGLPYGLHEKGPNVYAGPYGFTGFYPQVGGVPSSSHSHSHS